MWQWDFNGRLPGRLRSQLKIHRGFTGVVICLLELRCQAANLEAVKVITSIGQRLASRLPMRAYNSRGPVECGMLSITLVPKSHFGCWRNNLSPNLTITLCPHINFES